MATIDITTTNAADKASFPTPSAFAAICLETKKTAKGNRMSMSTTEGRRWEALIGIDCKVTSRTKSRTSSYYECSCGKILDSNARKSRYCRCSREIWREKAQSSFRAPIDSASVLRDCTYL